MNIEKIRADFPILATTVHGKPLVYLDSGATAQKPRRVIDKISELYTTLNSNIHRGVHYLSGQMTAEYELARERVRSFVGAESTREVIFTSGATASINLVASSYGRSNIGQGDEIIVSQMEHHSNIVPWQLLASSVGAKVVMLPFEDDGDISIDRFKSLLNNRTKMVAITAASNVLGTMPDLKQIIELSHSVGAKVMVDGCQGAVHGNVNVRDLDCDFYAFSGHKLYAPTGIGVLYGKEELLDAMPPYMGGGDMVHRVSFEKTTYAELPLKFEAGTSNFVGAIALGEAIEYLGQFDSRELVAHEQDLLCYATEQLSQIDGLTIYGTAKSKCSIISFNLDGVHPLDVGMILDKMGIAVRTGTHCAEPIMQRFDVVGMVRASFAIYNTRADVDALVKGVVMAANMLR